MRSIAGRQEDVTKGTKIEVKCFRMKILSQIISLIKFTQKQNLPGLFSGTKQILRINEQRLLLCDVNITDKLLAKTDKFNELVKIDDLRKFISIMERYPFLKHSVYHC